MKVTQKLAQAQQEDRTWWSFEFFPPRTAQGLQVRRFAHARPPPIEVLDDETPASFLNFESLILDGKTDSAPAPLFPDRTSMIGSNVYVLHPSSCLPRVGEARLGLMARSPDPSSDPGHRPLLASLALLFDPHR
jgi:hypothetical protein